MTFLQFTSLSALLGIGIPLIFQGVWAALDYLQYNNLEVHLVVQRLMLMLWPASLMRLPASDSPGFEEKLFFIALITNVAFYMIVGATIWLGIRKHIAFLVVAASAVIVIWWKLLTL
jgi:hypothetical protein